MPQTGEQLRRRYATDPEYREKKKALARESNRKRRDKIRIQHAARYDSDEVYRNAARDRAYRHRHGVTQAQKDQMIVDQGGACAACKIDFMYLPDRHQHVDHNHDTKRVRGVLCHNCNIALGNAKDSVERLYLLIGYLQRTDPEVGVALDRFAVVDTPTSGLTFVLETATGQAVTVTAPAERFVGVDTPKDDW